jgi:hypothetical protein
VLRFDARRRRGVTILRCRLALLVLVVLVATGSSASARRYGSVGPLASCSGTPVHLEPLPASGGLSKLPWVQALAHRAGIVGLIFGYDPKLQTDVARPTFALWTGGVAPAGGPAMKVLWIVRNPHAAIDLVVRGQKIGGRRSFVVARGVIAQDASSAPAQGFEYPSIVNIPSPGCWRLTVRSGAVVGSLVVAAYRA